MNIDKFVTFAVNKAHMFVGSIYGFSLAGYALHTGRPLDPGLVNATYAFYAFLAGHALTYQKYPDTNDSKDQG